MTLEKNPSLKSKLKEISTRWTFLGLALTMAISLPCFIFLSKQSAETKISTLARSVTRAFRPTLLEKNIRDAQFQMTRTLGLKDGEYVIVRDRNFKTIYSSSGTDQPNRCPFSERPCWDFVSASVTYLQPIYFNDDLKENLFGYVELKIESPLNWALLGIFLIFLFIVFSVIAFGLSVAQRRSVSLVKETMDKWAKHLQDSPDVPVSETIVPFSEMKNMELAVSKLHAQIQNMTQSAASDSRVKAQLSLVREIGHDLKTPFSQVAKFLAAFDAKVKRTGNADPELITQMHSSLGRMGDILRQIQVIGPSINNQGALLEGCDIVTEAQKFISDFEKHPDFEKQDVKIKFSSECASGFAQIPKTQFYRIIDNLIRNSLDAVDNKKGIITVTVTETNSSPTLVIEDNGIGILPENLKKIFDAEFTTKPARGTGLGLAIVNKICADFSATIQIESHAGVGTKIKVQFRAGFQTVDANDNFQKEAQI